MLAVVHYSILLQTDVAQIFTNYCTCPPKTLLQTVLAHALLQTWIFHRFYCFLSHMPAIVGAIYPKIFKSRDLFNVTYLLYCMWHSKIAMGRMHPIEAGVVPTVTAGARNYWMLLQPNFPIPQALRCCCFSFHLATSKSAMQCLELRYPPTIAQNLPSARPHYSTRR